MRRPARVRDHMSGLGSMGAFVAVPPFAWSGWRLNIEGGPEGGQYHGFIGPDSKGWHTTDRDEIGRAAKHGEPGPPPIPSDGPWDPVWGGTALHEGQTVSDYVYRGPAEMRPRPNASGGTNAIRAFQEERTAGYAEAPGNYKALGAVNPVAVRAPVPIRPMPPISSRPAPCPAWGCGAPPMPQPVQTPKPWPIESHLRYRILPPNWITGATSTVPQPPPPTSPAPSPSVGSSGCPAGEYRDSAGNCTSDWHNPYSLSLPPDESSGSSYGPSPTVAANTCPSGYSVDPNTGNCVVAGASTGLSAWLGGSTTIGGIQIPNALLAGAAALVAMKMLRK